MDGHIFRDRRHAGVILAERLVQYKDRDDCVVLGLPRGGVPVGYEVAAALKAPLDVFVVRKLGVPGHRELAMGAIASGGVRVLNEAVVSALRISQADIEATARQEQVELERRERVYRNGRDPISLQGRTAVIVDDGLATGSTMKAAIEAVRQSAAARIVVAVPVGALETCEELRRVADEVVCARSPEHFAAVGLWYANFEQTSDSEVRELLRKHAENEWTS